MAHHVNDVTLSTEIYTTPGDVTRRRSVEEAMVGADSEEKTRYRGADAGVCSAESAISAASALAASDSGSALGCLRRHSPVE